MTAMGLIRALQTLRVRVPEDFSVIGFDNIPVGELCAPPLTTIDQHAAQLGARAFDRLISQIENENQPADTVRLAPELIRRQSTADAPVE